jgi:hypothetical protein
MSKGQDTMSTHQFMDGPAQYQIQVQGHLPDRWHEMFGDLHAQIEGGSEVITTMTGCLPDQAALNGILQALYGLGLPILLVRRIEPVRPTKSNQPEMA